MGVAKHGTHLSYKPRFKTQILYELKTLQGLKH